MLHDSTGWPQVVYLVWTSCTGHYTWLSLFPFPSKKESLHLNAWQLPNTLFMSQRILRWNRRNIFRQLKLSKWKGFWNFSFTWHFRTVGFSSIQTKTKFKDKKQKYEHLLHQKSCFAVNPPSRCVLHFYHMNMGLSVWRARQTLQQVGDVAVISNKTFRVTDRKPYSLSRLWALCGNSFAPYLLFLFLSCSLLFTVHSFLSNQRIPS